MPGTGPAPNPQSRKQTGGQAHTWTDLPTGGYQGEIPEWPLGASSDRELEVWSQIWRTPQAAAWSLLGWSFDIALYVRWTCLADFGSLQAGTEARQWSDRLGLNPTAMLKNRWRVRPDEVAERRTAKAPVRSRRRLKVADDAVAGS